MNIITCVRRRYSNHLIILLGLTLLGLAYKYLYHSVYITVKSNSTSTILTQFDSSYKSDIDHMIEIPDAAYDDTSVDEVIYQNNENLHLVDDLELPSNGEVRKVVHFVWCGHYSGPFAYRNYLAVKSAYTFLKPDRIYFHCNQVPNKFHDYETWFNDTLKEYPWLVIEHGEYICSRPSDVKRYIFQALHKYQGVYIGEDTIITGVGPGFWTNSSFRSTIVSKNNNNGYVAVTENHTHYDMLQWETDLQLLRLSNASEACISIEDGDLEKRMLSPIPEGYLRCVCINQKFFPKNISGRRDILGRTLNYIMYGQPNTPEPVPSENNDDLIPNIAHLFWMSGKEMNYLFYLCCLSLLYIVKVDNLYIHGDYPPRGKYWDLITQEPRLMFMKKELPTSIWGQEAKLPTGLSDIFRADIMIRYGGIYSDVDVIWTQPIPEHIRRYGAVAALDWAHFFFNYPDYINLGVTLGKKGAKFWHLFLDSMKDFQDTMGYNGILKPYKVYERHPETLFMYPELQVMCFRDDCHPLSGKNYAEIDWRKDTHAFHWTHPDPFELTSEEALLASNSVFADIGKHVLKAAGLLKT